MDVLCVREATKFAADHCRSGKVSEARVTWVKMANMPSQKHPDEESAVFLEGRPPPFMASNFKVTRKKIT